MPPNKFVLSWLQHAIRTAPGPFFPFHADGKANFLLLATDHSDIVIIGFLRNDYACGVHWSCRSRHNDWRQLGIPQELVDTILCTFDLSRYMAKQDVASDPLPLYIQGPATSRPAIQKRQASRAVSAQQDVDNFVPTPTVSNHHQTSHPRLPCIAKPCHHAPSNHRRSSPQSHRGRGVRSVDVRQQLWNRILLRRRDRRKKDPHAVAVIWRRDCTPAEKIPDELVVICVQQNSDWPGVRRTIFELCSGASLHKNAAMRKAAHVSDSEDPSISRVWNVQHRNKKRNWDARQIPKDSQSRSSIGNTDAVAGADNPENNSCPEDLQYAAPRDLQQDSVRRQDIAHATMMETEFPELKCTIAIHMAKAQSAPSAAATGTSLACPKTASPIRTVPAGIPSHADFGARGNSERTPYNRPSDDQSELPDYAPPLHGPMQKLPHGTVLKIEKNKERPKLGLERFVPKPIKD
ncbi:hypothetical protein DOTSEDRAFT_76415 [Dothistroma septosporum NZE10]|uniref:Uncharacterized protein n=1 Tax=Dothistroma septosporum (strain NZE10 / CBS 128990) TaxID=675120 RepID=N1Q2Q8_DOTSN|nr:hypothetical protein DOTSEDRAFT_76415 [Dothistroma septosporum NZE10]